MPPLTTTNSRPARGGEPPATHQPPALDRDDRQHAWQLAGKKGDAPDAVVDAVALTLSSFATKAMIDDLRIGLDRTATHTASMLAATITAVR